jgi:molybdopterin synthase catalytic subunit
VIVRGRAVPVASAGDRCPYDVAVHPPLTGDTWVGIGSEVLPADDAVAWSTMPSCGAVVSFLGVARDHSDGRSGVWRLEYEAYESQVVPCFEAIDSALRQKWPDVGRVVMLHRNGIVDLGEAAVVVVISAPHRGAAFAAAEYAIDTLKATAPIWKRESWADGESWSLEAAR